MAADSEDSKLTVSSHVESFIKAATPYLRLIYKNETWKTKTNNFYDCLFILRMEFLL